MRSLTMLRLKSIIQNCKQAESCTCWAAKVPDLLQKLLLFLFGIFGFIVSLTSYVFSSFFFFFI